MSVWLDIRYAVHNLRRTPGFTLVAILSLALGIGANTAIFSLIDVLMLRMLPVRAPAGLVQFVNQYPGDPPLNVFSLQSYEYFRARNHAFSALTAVRASRLRLRGEGLDPEFVYGESVAGNYFEALGVRPVVGQAPGAGEVLIGWSYWKSRFNLEPSILGRHLILASSSLEDTPVTVSGVAPRGFDGLRPGVRTDVWTPLGGSGGPVAVIARLEPGVSMEQARERARAEMAVLFRFTLEERTRGSKDPLMRQLTFRVEPAGHGLSSGMSDRFAKPLLALMAAVGLLLLIACTNLAGLLLARGASRRREMAVRVSLGAGRFRLSRQVLTESLLLSAAGAALGVALAYLSARALVGIMLSGRPLPGMSGLEFDVRPDPSILLFTAAIALLAGLLFGTVPAWRAFAVNPAPSLRDSGRATETRLGRLFGKCLVVAQMALSMGLLSAAGLFVHHLSELERLDLGFRKEHVLLVSLDPARSGYAGERLAGAYEELLRRFRAIPGVRAATISGPGPISGAAASRFVNVEGHPERPEDRRYVSVAWVAPQYFETLGVPLIKGRDFQAEDGSGPRVAIINRSMARYYFGAADPIGRSFTFDGDQKPCRIVGVAGDAKYMEIREPWQRTIYLDTFQSTQPSSAFALSTTVEPQIAGPAVRAAVQEVLKNVPVARMTTLEAQVDASIVPERMIAALAGLFGLLGAVLAAIGVYGLTAYTVAGRAREMGVRIALGATRNGVLGMVLREAFTIGCVGIAFGAPLAWWAGRMAATLIGGLPQPGVLPIAFAGAAMLVIASTAALVPARRASRVDPVEALRAE